MPVYKKNDLYYARVNHVGINGKYKSVQSKYFKTKREAEDAEIELRQKLKNTDTYSITFEEAYKEFRVWKLQQVKLQTVIKYDELFNHMEPLYKVKVEKLSIQQYKAFKKYLEDKGLSDDRKIKIHRFVTTLINYCDMAYGIKNDNPKRAGGFKRTAPKKEMQFFTLEEFEKFIDAIDSIEYKTLFTLLFFNGLRIGEALALKWSDLNNNHISITKNLVVRVKGTKPFISSPKTEKSNRVLPINARTQNALNDLKTYYMKLDGFNEDWWIFGGIKNMSETSITNAKNAACKKANVKEIRIHDFRHSCASYYIKYKSAPIILVSKLLGHSKISITLDTYSHMYPNDLDELMK